MLVLERRTGQSLIIQPSEDIPADMTVADLFANDPIEISIGEVLYSKLKVGVEASTSKVLNIVRDELWSSSEMTESDHK